MEAESAVTKGWLIKKTGILKSRCWFWLVEDKLMYSKAVSAFDGSAKFHAIDLSLAHQVRKTESPFSFEIVSRKEHFVLIAATQAECDDWVKTLQVAMQSHKRSSQVWRSSESSNDALRSSSTNCAAAVAGQGTSDVHEDNAPTEQLFQLPSPHENDIDREASCGAPDSLSGAPTSMDDVGKASDSCRVLANYPTAVDLAAHLARKKTLLHRYEDINSPEEERTEIGGAAADLVCQPSDKRHDRHSRRSCITTHELVVLEVLDNKDERTANVGDPPKRFSIQAGLKAENRPRDSFVGSDVRLKGTTNPIGSSAYEEITLEALPPNTRDAEDFDSSALYSQIQRQPQTTTTSTDHVTSSDVQCMTVSHPRSEQPRSMPQFNQRSQDEEQQQVQIQRGCDLIGTSAPPGLEEQPLSLPLPRPAMRIVETEDDVYAKLQCDCKSSAQDSSCAAAANDQLPSKATLSAILADELTASDAPRVRAYRPQPYSHAVSLLKEHLVREGAFGMRFASHRL